MGVASRMFEFSGMSGFKQFVRGNLQHGDGVREQGQRPAPAAGEPPRNDP